MHEDILRGLFSALGIYRQSGGFPGAEAAAVAHGLDAVFERLTKIETEGSPDTAREEGLSRWGTLFAHGLIPGSLGERRAALRALLNISGDGLRRGALEEALLAAGTRATVMEDGVQCLRVEFPGIPGIPENFERMRPVIEDILPCHLEIKYRFWYQTWLQFEARFPTFAALDDCGLSWADIERLVEDDWEG